MTLVNRDAHSVRRLIGSVSVGCLATSFVACQWVAGLDRPSSDAVEVMDSSADETATVAQDAGDGAATSCVPRAPARPAATPVGGVPLAFVLTTGLLPDTSPFDLDCTDSRCADGGVTPPYACAPRNKNARFCDAPIGGDNQMRAAQSNHAIDIGDAVYRSNLRNGGSGIVMAVLDYNGADEDSDVSLAVFLGMPSGEHLCPPYDADASVADASPEGGPLLNGCDTFSGDQNDVAAGRPTIVARGYVTGGTLYVTEPHRQLIAYRSRFVEAEGLMLEARLRTPAGGPATLQGSFGGRVTPEALLRVIGEQVDTDASPNPFCVRMIWPTIRAVVCSELDMPSGDAAFPTDLCGTMSFLINFDAVQVRLSQSATVVPKAALECVASNPKLDGAAPNFSCP